jgi:hypothetical protein
MERIDQRNTQTRSRRRVTSAHATPQPRVSQAARPGLRVTLIDAFHAEE